MPITKNGQNQVVYTDKMDRWDSDTTGVFAESDFAVADDINVLKQIKFQINPTTDTPGTITLQADIAGNQTINLSSLTSTNSFSTIQPITGTSPVASSPSDTLTLTSGDSTITIIGNSATDTLDFRVNSNSAITSLTGDVTATGPGSVAATIGTNKVTNAKAAQMPTNTIKGNNTGSTANASDLTVAQTITMLGIASGTQFITSGTTYTTPANITTATQFKFTLIGGGGGGAGINTSNRGAAGGGGGGSIILFITGLTPSTGYTIAIGAGGTAGAATPTAGGDGGNTTLLIGATTYTAGGGKGGPLGSASNGGLGGGCINGTILIQGSGGGAVVNANGTSGFGGNSIFGFGGASVTSATNGISGSGYGGGGGGGQSTTATGGSGTQGCILVSWTNK